MLAPIDQSLTQNATMWMLSLSQMQVFADASYITPDSLDGILTNLQIVMLLSISNRNTFQI